MLGTTIHSHYKIVKFLGIGRSGTAYLAEDLDLPECPPCLVKNFHDSDSTLAAKPLLHKLFELQGSILHKVGQHPRIPTLIAKFEENGNRYFVREYIDGDLLSQEISRGSTWTQIQVFDFIIDLMEILSFVHKFKYIHQDINPRNIIRRKDNGRFSLIGFSSVKNVESVWHNIPEHPESNINVAIGTPGYTPYEQEQNASQFNSDIYAVGVIAIQALTNEFPIDRNPRSYELKWRDGVNINLRLMNIIDKMVRPDYRNRYQSVQEVLKDLQSFALTQIPPSRFDKLKPHLIFSGTAFTLLLGFGAVKLFSASAEKPIAEPLVAVVTSSPSVSNDRPIVANSNTSWQTYIDTLTGIKIKYYPTWKIEDLEKIHKPDNVVFYSPIQNSTDKYREAVSVRVENISKVKTNLADYTKSSIAKIRSSYKYAKITESSSVKLSKKPANLVIYTGIDKNGFSIKNLEVLTIDQGKAYTVTYTAEPAQYYTFLQTVMTMINSFELN